MWQSSFVTWTINRSSASFCSLRRMHVERLVTLHGYSVIPPTVLVGTSATLLHWRSIKSLLCFSKAPKAGAMPLENLRAHIHRTKQMAKKAPKATSSPGLLGLSIRRAVVQLLLPALYFFVMHIIFNIRNTCSILLRPSILQSRSIVNLATQNKEGRRKLSERVAVLSHSRETQLFSRPFGPCRKACVQW